MFKDQSSTQTSTSKT